MTCLKQREAWHPPWEEELWGVGVVDFGVCVVFVVLRLEGVQRYPICSKRGEEGVQFFLEFMTKEAGDEDDYNVGIVRVRRDHTHHSEELEAELRGCQR